MNTFISSARATQNFGGGAYSSSRAHQHEHEHESAPTHPQRLLVVGESGAGKVCVLCRATVNIAPELK